MAVKPIPASAHQPRHQWHAHPIEKVTQHLGTHAASGLSLNEAEARLADQGYNEIREGKRRSVLLMFLAQFADFMILVLIGAAVIAGFVGDMVDTVAILVIVLLNAMIGFIQEFRAEKAISALKQMAAPSARVVRDNQVRQISARELVPGDVVLLEAGNVVPADLRLIEAAQFKVEEAALTGESLAVDKNHAVLEEESTILAERRNMVHKGTMVASGRARGIVVATGMQTELGRIAQLLSTGKEALTPLQQRLAQFGKQLALIVLAICAIIFVIGVMRGEPIALMFLTAVSLVVAAIPEALPAVITISLALGARKLVKQQALIRKLPAVETLGSVTYICSDKTGTLTLNKMQVQSVAAAGELRHVNDGWPAGPTWQALFQAMALNNDSRMGAQGEWLGDPTETALLSAALDSGLDLTQLASDYSRMAELPFDSDRKRMTTLHRNPKDGAVMAYIKGAPEMMLDRCRTQWDGQAEAPIDTQAILDEASKMAHAGLRVMAFAMRTFDALPAELSHDAVEADMVFLGLVGMMDPPRAEAAEAVRLCKTAGIVPVMITGDHPATARAIAHQLGILDGEGRVMTGKELAHLSQSAFEDRVEHIRVYARVDPEQKIKIVQGLQDKGEFVAMTGDGVNDAPALKRANIGIAMGKGGTDVAREASHMILLDDNFATIVGAVREGRRIFDNIRKFIKYTMTDNSGEILVLFLAPFLFLPIPLLPIHILWVNLVTDGLPGLALAAEKEERGVMQRPPRPPNENIFAHGMWQHVLWAGLLIAGLCLFTQAWAIHNDSAAWQTMVFTVLVFAQLFHALAIRSETDSLFTIGWFSNRFMAGAVIISALMQLAVVYVPFLQPIFKTQALSMHELLFCIGMASIVLFAVELEKWMKRRGWLYRETGAMAASNQ